MSWRAVTLLAMILSLASVDLVRADEGASAAIVKARRHVQFLEYDQAIMEIEAARRAAPTDAQRVELSMLQGLVDLALGREAAGVEAFRSALRISPSLPVPTQVSPRVAKAFDRARRLELERSEARAHARAQLLPIAIPEVAHRAFDVPLAVEGEFATLGARLKLEDRLSHETFLLPFARVRAGHWVARVHADLATPGRTLFARAELIDDDEVIRVEPSTELVKLVVPTQRAALSVSTPLLGAAVSVDGTIVGRTPIGSAIPVAPGRRRVVLHARGGGTVLEDVVIMPGEHRALTLNVDVPAARRAIARPVLFALGGALVVTGTVLVWQSTIVGSGVDDAARDRNQVTGLPAVGFDAVRGDMSAERAMLFSGIAALSLGGLGALTAALLYVPSRGRASRPSLAASGVGLRF